MHNTQLCGNTKSVMTGLTLESDIVTASLNIKGVDAGKNSVGIYQAVVVNRRQTEF